MKTIRLLAIIEATSITGPAKNLLRFAEAARSARFGTRVEVSVITFERGEKENLFLRSAQEAGICTIPVQEAGAFDRSIPGRLAAAARAAGPDLIQTHAVKSHFLAVAAGLSKIAPWIAFHHGYTWPNLKARLYNQLDRWSVRRADAVLTVSLPFREQMIAMGVRPERVKIIHNAIDPDWGLKLANSSVRGWLRNRLAIADEKKVILIVGRLSKEKDHRTLLNAMSRLRKTHPVHLVIVGDGSERANIEEQIRTLNLGGNATITGQVPSAEPYYSIAEVSVLSSLSEGSPNALLEAMAARVPSVATRVGGIPEIVADRESALLVEPRDEQAMATAIGELLSDPPLRESLVENAHRLIVEKYSPERRTQQLIDVYSGILDAKGQGTESGTRTQR